ncbi:MAG: pyruvate kinase [Polyangiaceae bacterium]|nr:pyruvate kinase [Polyangiaceae bacterium]MCE7893636.1 pyruvate kinase [Sorangiineae bacterium PRO1]MCL4749400.1 pyruvate kinase [Myxococcales bacterium]
MTLRRAKIVCTLGPAVQTPERIAELIAAGMDVARLNFSHGTHADHGRMVELIRDASATAGKPVAILQDLCGPKIRTSSVVPSSLEVGQSVDLVARAPGDDKTIGVDYDGLHEDLRAGDRILLGDGQVELRVEQVADERVMARVDHGGALRARMGVNLPSHRVRFGGLTQKDREDLAFGLGLGVDYVALSFVRSAADVEELRELCAGHGRPTPIVAKIETPSAVESIESIVQAADAAMVARGDLGVELPPERVPVVQRQIIGTCRALKKPVIVATEMLQSMVDAPRPTRAEASDVAGAVFGGADAVMLSGETATGKFPIRACQMMDRIIREAEASPFFQPVPSERGSATAEAIAHAACSIAREVGAKVIVALTESGGTARLVSKARPMVPLVALSPDERTLRRLALFWGVSPRALDVVTDLEVLAARTRALLVDSGMVAVGDRFVIVYGAPVGGRGSTNALRVEVVK